MDISKEDLARLDRSVDSIRDAVDPGRLRKKLEERPLMIELFGTPKAGKSTMKEFLKHSFKRLGLSVSSPTEGAEVVEWVKRVEPDYNFQTVEYALSAARQRAFGPGHRDFHVVIFDRGIYDGVMRMDYYAHNGTITDAQRAAVESYLLLPFNRRLFDFHICMVCSVEEAIQRELAKAIVQRHGETMNPATLQDLRAAHDRIWARLRCGTDPSMLWHDSTGETPTQTAWTIIQASVAALQRSSSARVEGAGK